MTRPAPCHPGAGLPRKVRAATSRATPSAAGRSQRSVPGHDLAVLAAWAVAGLLARLRFFRWAPQVPARNRRPAGFRARDVAV